MDPVTNTDINLSWEVLLLCHSSDMVAKQPLYGGVNYYILASFGYFQHHLKRFIKREPLLNY